MLAYKYRSGAAFNETGTNLHIDALKNSYVWSAKIETLNDPCESMFDCEYFKPELELLIKIFLNDDISEVKVRGQLQTLYSQLDAVIASCRKAGIFSLSKTFTDELMWSYYADAHKGFCIEYETEI